MEITGVCTQCGDEDILNVKGGICYRCWCHLDLLEHEKLIAEEE